MAARPPRPPAAPWGPAFEGALQAGLSVVIGIVAGYYADRWLGTSPFLLIFLTVAGVVAAVRCLIELTQLAQPSEQDHGSTPSAADPTGTSSQSRTGQSDLHADTRASGEAEGRGLRGLSESDGGAAGDPARGRSSDAD